VRKLAHLQQWRREFSAIAPGWITNLFSSRIIPGIVQMNKNNLTLCSQAVPACNI
jgi:hypothetical protein